ncbi:Tn3 family transposase [Streptosporangium roseum]|uniref:Tn3 family transposase n=1 Tax=Streptosporangium roseum TaxID=2001 RepID=UPI00331CFF52
MQNLHTGHSPLYFGRQRGATWLNVVNNQVMGISGLVVPGTLRAALFILDAIFNFDGRLARKIAFGNRGQLRQRYREGLEDQLGSLGLALNAVTITSRKGERMALGRLRDGGLAGSVVLGTGGEFSEEHRWWCDLARAPDRGGCQRYEQVGVG